MLASKRQSDRAQLPIRAGAGYAIGARTHAQIDHADRSSAAAQKARPTGEGPARNRRYQASVDDQAGRARFGDLVRFASSAESH
jgi:hypothetical protein